MASDADILCIQFNNGNTKYRIYSIKKIQSKKSYFLKKDIKTNFKKNENWGSAFIPIKIDDNILISCEINTIKDLLNVRE